jgi:hypothetical protein
MCIYLCTYRPLIGSQAGREAISEYQLPPYIDASFRREPDFECEYPSISALCHGGKFAPHRSVGDIVVYMTRQGKYPDASVKENHWRLTAILKVYQRFNTHQDAAIWYQKHQGKLPRNCVVPGNSPVPLAQSEDRFHLTPPPVLIPPRYARYQLSVLNNDLGVLDKFYEERAEKWGVFLACTACFKELYSPPFIMIEQMLEIFGRIPGTRSCCRVSEEEFKKLCSYCGISSC